MEKPVLTAAVLYLDALPAGLAVPRYAINAIPPRLVSSILWVYIQDCLPVKRMLPSIVRLSAITMVQATTGKQALIAGAVVVPLAEPAEPKIAIDAILLQLVFPI